MCFILCNFFTYICRETLITNHEQLVIYFLKFFQDYIVHDEKE